MPTEDWSAALDTKQMVADLAAKKVVERKMVCYYQNYLITDEQAQALENTGAAHVATGASGGVPSCGNIAGIVGHDPNQPWMIMMPGPGNCWIETVEGNCTHCGCQARLHVKKLRSDVYPGDWGTLCDCGCRVDIPYGKVDAVLGLH